MCVKRGKLTVRKEKKERPGKVGVGKFWAWQSRGISLAANFLVLGYLSMYCTDALHMSAGLVGTLLLLSKVFDGITDLFAGYLIDNTNTRWGKARPYELAIFGVWFCTWMLYSCPEDASVLVKCIWIFLLYTLTNSVFATLLNANGNPYILRAFKRQEQYVTINVFGGLAIMLSSIVMSMSLPVVIAQKAVTAAGWSSLIMMYAIPLAIIGIMRFVFIKEDTNIEAEVKDKVRVKELFLILKRNRYIYPVVGVTFLFQFIVGMNVGNYYFKYVIGDLASMGIFGLLSIVVLPVMVFFPILIKKYSVAQIMAAGSIIGSIGGLIAFFAGTNIPILLVAGLMGSMATLAPSYMTALMLLDCGRYNELNGMARMDGTICAVNNFASKLGSGIGSGLVGVVLGIAGYNGELAVQTSTVNMTLRGIYGLVPFVGYMAVAILMSRYKLNKVNDELQAKQQNA